MKKLRENPWFKLLTNVYALIGLFFVIWMVFLDTNSRSASFGTYRKHDDLATLHYRTRGKQAAPIKHNIYT